jgi:hypothetical protein
MRKVSYKTVLRDLYEDTDIQNLKIDAVYLTRLIRKADKKIEGLYTVNVDKEVMTVTNNELPFPDDLFNIDFVLLGDFSDNNAYFINNSNDFIVNLEVTETLDNINVYRLWSDISFSIESTKIDYVIANGKIQIDPAYEGQTVTLIYTKYPKNKKGEFMINENHVDPIIAWIKYHLFDREMYRRKMSGRRMGSDDFAFMRHLGSRKNQLIRNARVEDRRLNEEYVSKDIISNYYNAMIEYDY